MPYLSTIIDGRIIRTGLWLSPYYRHKNVESLIFITPDKREHVQGKSKRSEHFKIP
jgi:hypothetical protein